MAPSTSFSGDNLATLTFRSIKSTLSNGSISLEPIHSDIVKLQTSNANISGVFEAGHVDLSSSNGSISVELNMKDAIDGEQSKVLTQTSNASIDMHVTATETSHGLWMKILTRNDRISVGALIGKADRASSINASTSNAKINFNVDASQTGQALEIVNKTTNGGIVSSVMAPKDRPLKGIAESSNASISVNLTEEFEGKFRLETSNASTIVEGTHLVLEHDKTYLKNGYRIKKGPSEFTALSSNGSAALRFYPAGLSSASA
ncbi:hypothetical protein BCR41DRAFT_351215 [Lobosporangium transversale]|uniref:Uncharacterized protein n=1 Tax=Lobosporangium transversale TaxID=64571 RepID=A0A1Y2GTL6_9FUNG|nr:hypothetical protein BCR41DRAFT_351215 [Lobosporangium transversale]ORZ20070.1 hypothetical protein BCR41DRAFT_351215 [Lobosporangium transversale]|eukprot:XP_021882610.1 hypothetical protein BCR41DRAFT_351215 [Lobosporangium transversale]